jgi:hypothetical protein
LTSFRWLKYLPKTRWFAMNSATLILLHNNDLSLEDLGCHNPTLGLNVRKQFTFPKMGKWSPFGFPKTQSLIWGAKSPCIGVFLVSLKRSWSVNV